MTTPAESDPAALPWGDATAVDATPVATTDVNPVYFGKHRVCYELASGGMGKVYLARTEGPGGLERPVAIKTIRPEYAADPRAVEMFLREARIASQIGHPNVCPVFDFGEQGGTYYIAMEYLVGEPLALVMHRLTVEPVLRQNTRRYALAAKVIADAAEGLHAAHELRDPSGEPLGVIHRDISPQNIFVTYDGSVRVMDFGIARAHHDLTLSGQGTVRGRLGYLAPEQLKQGSVVDRRADIWALGVVLWELIVLRPLFDCKAPAQAIQEVLSRQIAAPSAIAGRAPRELDRIVLKALARDPAQRYASAREMARALTELLGQYPPPVALAEIGDWMARVFPEGQQRRRRLVDTVTTGNSAQTSGTDTLPSRAMSPAAVEPALPLQARARWRWAAIAAVVVGGVGTVAAIVAHEQTPAPMRAPAPPAVPAAPSPRLPGAAPGQLAVGEPASIATAGSTAARSSSGVPTSQSRLNASARPTTMNERAARPRGTPRGTSTVTSASGEGQVAIVTPGGWATVSLGRARLGQSPLVVSLPVGTHMLTLRPFDDGASQSVNVRVRHGELARVVVPLRSEGSR